MNQQFLNLFLTLYFLAVINVIKRTSFTKRHFAITNWYSTIRVLKFIAFLSLNIQLFYKNFPWICVHHHGWNNLWNTGNCKTSITSTLSYYPCPITHPDNVDNRERFSECAKGFFYLVHKNTGSLHYPLRWRQAFLSAKIFIN